jgi:hypothetical protein
MIIDRATNNPKAPMQPKSFVYGMGIEIYIDYTPSSITDTLDWRSVWYPVHVDVGQVY